MCEKSTTFETYTPNNENSFPEDENDDESPYVASDPTPVTVWTWSKETTRGPRPRPAPRPEPIVPQLSLNVPSSAQVDVPGIYSTAWSTYEVETGCVAMTRVNTNMEQEPETYEKGTKLRGDYRNTVSRPQVFYYGDAELTPSSLPFAALTVRDDVYGGDTHPIRDQSTSTQAARRMVIGQGASRQPKSRRVKRRLVARTTRFGSDCFTTSFEYKDIIPQIKSLSYTSHNSLCPVIDLAIDEEDAELSSDCETQMGSDHTSQVQYGNHHHHNMLHRPRDFEDDLRYIGTGLGLCHDDEPGILKSDS